MYEIDFYEYNKYKYIIYCKNVKKSLNFKYACNNEV